MYEIFVQLMDERNITSYRVSKDTGVPQTTLSGWKSGGKPRSGTLRIIADYFGVSVAYLKGETDDRGQKEAPAGEGERTIKNPDIRMIARAGHKMTPEQSENLRKYAQYMFPEAFEDDNP